MKESKILLKRLAFSKRCGDRRSWLRYEIGLACDWLWYDAAVMLMSPDNEIDGVGKHAFGDVRCGRMSNTTHHLTNGVGRVELLVRTDFGAIA